MSPPSDVLVVGGGPAGSICALRLARLGFDVRLIEAHGSPRAHIGEAVTEGVRRQLAHLGLEALLDRAGWQPFAHVDERWADASLAPRAAPPGAATVNRARFDAALLDRCRTEGVGVTLGRSVTTLRRLSGGGWEAGIKDAPAQRAQFVVDASGRRGVLPKARQRSGARTIALYGYWRGRGLPERPRISSGKSSWAWGAPVSGLGYNATLFVDPDMIARSGGDLRRAYVEGLADCAFFDSVPPPEPGPPVTACDATAWHDEEAAGADFIKVGEAAQSLDPLASMGVQKAIQMAGSASIVINTTLRRPGSWEIAARFYQERVRLSARAHVRSVSELYGQCACRAAPFWRRRAETGEMAKSDPVAPSALCPDLRAPIRIDTSRLIDHPCLCGDFVEMRPAVLAGPQRDPVAFIGDLALSDAIELVRLSSTLDEMQMRIARRQGPRVAAQIVAWLVHNGIVAAA